MNDKDKEAYNNWIKNRDYHFDMDGEAWLNKEVVSIFSETKDAWQAACEYKQKEIDELKSALVDVYDWYGMFMGDVADKIKKAKVLGKK